MVRRHARSGSPYEAQCGFSRAVRIGDRILVAGTAPIDDDGTTHEGDAEAQTRRCFTIIGRALAELGASFDDVVRTRLFITDSAHWEGVARVHGELFQRARPAATCVVVAGLLDPAWKVEIEVEAQVSG